MAGGLKEDSVILQAGGQIMTVTRRGYPDTPEAFPGGGFVVLSHTRDETGLTYTTAHEKADFDRDPAACAAEHLRRCGPKAL